MPDGTEPIADDEILYRRIPVSTNWYNSDIDRYPSPKAFRALPRDETGISVYRRKYKTSREVARNERGASYYVAVLRAGDLRELGIDVEPDPQAGNRGHARLPGLRYDNRRDTEHIQLLIAEKLCLGIEGPYP